ncbi:MAG: kelch repeat-containing protein [Bacteroidota bacterium]
MKLLIQLFLISSFFLPSTFIAQTWNQLDDFPALDRDDAAFFRIGDCAYVGSGMTTGWTILGDFYKFNLNTEQWSTCTSLPSGKERQYAAGFSHGEKGYLFGGYNGTFLSDFWCYDPVADAWTEITAIPALGRSGMSCFVIGDTAYILGGKTANESAIDEVWAYNLVANNWTQKNDLPNGNRWRATAIQNGNVSLLGFGKDEVGVSHSDFYSYDATSDTWSSIADFPSVGRNYVAGMGQNAHLFVAFGIDDANTFYKDCWEYNTLNDTWNFVIDLPADERKGGCLFSGTSGLYYTTGIDKDYVRLQETWRLSLPLSVDENQLGSLTVFPNPNKGMVTIKSDVLLVKCEVLTMQGQKVWELDNKLGINEIDLVGIENGMYVMRMQAETGRLFQTLVLVE